MATHPIDNVPEPRKVNFTESKMPNEPPSDVKLKLETGEELRERLHRIEHVEGITFGFTYTKLDANGDVLLASNGQTLISPMHEVAFMGENAANIDINSALREGRKVAAAKAADYFIGLSKLTNIMVDRLYPAPRPPVTDLPGVAAAIRNPGKPDSPLPSGTEVPGVGQPVSPNAPVSPGKPA